MSVTGLAGMYNLKGLTPELLPPAEVFAGSTALFRIRIRNTKRRLPSFLIHVSCSHIPGVTVPIVPANANIECRLPALFQQRGSTSVGTVTISSPFPVNFFTRFWTFTGGDEFIVYPRLVPGNQSGTAREQRPNGSAVSHERGHDGELERIAAYSGREPLRVIHWKLSARNDDLLVKEFGRQTAPPLLIDLDQLPGVVLDERVSRAAWLVRHWVQQRPVGLTLGDHTIAPAMGPLQDSLLLKELALHGLD